MSLIWNIYIFGVCLVLEIHICKYSHSRRLKIVHALRKKINCPASVWRKCFGEMIQPFCRKTHFGNSHWPVLGAMSKCLWAETEIFFFFFKMKLKLKEGKIWVNEEKSEDFRKEDLRWMWKEELGRRFHSMGWNHMRVWERFGLGNSLFRYVLFQSRGRKLSSLQKQDREVNRGGVGGGGYSAHLQGAHCSVLCRKEGRVGLEKKKDCFWKRKLSDF